MNTVVEVNQFAALAADLELMGVFAVLAAENGPRATFMIANALGTAKGWPRRAVPAARQKLLALGLIECVRRPGKDAPGLYRWRIPEN